MDRSQFSRSKTGGFTLTEVLVALFVLAVGLASVAALLASTVSGTATTEYMTKAAALATEKLEDLNRFPAGDPNVAVTVGNTAGSITADTSATVTSNATTENVDYFDEIFFSPTSGSVSETVSGLDVNGNPQYTTTAQQPNGTISVTQTGSRASLVNGAIYFKRRWVIEANQPINGLRRITVYVFLENASVAPGVNFQMSVVRP
ncbi:MAG TPA: prepilin-type N-terminal cleavage/methylation domain-containing protein [Candidatus Acidoferrales bacterium]|nr:prepilin-type N-terminal cleavage/methylation domain-containing protein [Candidatus Acidoferrales bacterium]